MKVLHLANGNLYGGIERFLVSLALVQRDSNLLENVYLLSHEGRLARELRNAGFEPEILQDTRISRPWTIVRARRRVRGCVSALRPDLVVSHGPWTHAVLAPAVREGRPLVHYCHNPPGTDWLHRLAARCVPDRILANSEFTRRPVSSVFPGVPSEVVPYVLQLPAVEVLEPYPERRGDSELVIAQVGRLERWKGHALLLAAAEHLRDMPGWQIWIIGGAQRPAEDEYLGELKARASKGSIAHRVHFLGERHDVAALLRAADIFCQPNQSPEPFGLVFVEAMAAGLPIVTTIGGGPAEFLSSDMAAQSSPDPTALAENLRSLILDPQRRQRMGQAAADLFKARFEPLQALRALHQALQRALPGDRRALAWV
jgi:glycosyltransferase involved in cell wall biosynthesis